MKIYCGTMKIYLLLLLLTVGFCSCSKYVQVYETKSTNLGVENDIYSAENDSLSIRYTFWANKGIVSFVLYNKLDNPLYIDWKKSSFIDNSIKLDYWIDEEKKVTRYHHKRYLFTGSADYHTLLASLGGNTSVSTTTTTKPERITFIPPKASYYGFRFFILPQEKYEFEFDQGAKEVERNDNQRKITIINTQQFEKVNSPSIFRNFLTLSYSEDFNQEFYLDHEFYISEVKEMELKHFEFFKLTENGKAYIKDEQGIPIKFQPYKSHRSFYIKL